MSKRGSKQKKLGQCFLIDRSVVHRIVDESGLGKGDTALEVGPGRGILTRALLDTGAKVYAVELDQELYTRLEQELGSYEKLTIERYNALKFDYGSVPAPYYVISNLPYSVSVPLIKKFVENLDKIKSMILMVQAEVGRRLTARPGDANFGSLSLFTAYHMNTRYLFTVPPKAFRPQPKVDSAVIGLEPLEAPPVIVSDKDDFFRFINGAFMHRRKTLRNNLKKMWSEQGAIDDIFADTEINPDMRPQDVSLEQYADLYERWISAKGSLGD